MEGEEGGGVRVRGKGEDGPRVPRVPVALHTPGRHEVVLPAVPHGLRVLCPPGGSRPLLGPDSLGAGQGHAENRKGSLLQDEILQMPFGGKFYSSFGAIL
jgi:hypothetical protein